MSEKTMPVADALDHLVQQFADPLSCLRELAQNSIDAGSRQVDVNSDYDPEQGVLCLEVQDYGDGMDRAIIDSRLTRLFSSAKDGDLTKIGRFGIGFVSVFALAPDAVVVDTGRGGEWWRVLFRKDRSFSRIALEQPVDGTRVRIYKAMDAAAAEALVARAEQVLTYWCKHVDAEIYFDDAPVTRPLDLDAAWVQRGASEGTEILVGLSEAPFAGFYNKGLTLLESTSEGVLPGVAFKVSSRDLEHTLTRDNVVHDAHYLRAMQAVRALVDGALLDALLAALATPERAAALGHFERLLSADALPERALAAPVFGGLGGAVTWSVQALREARPERRWWAAHDGPVVAALAQAGHTVVVADEAEVALLERVVGAEVPDAHAAFVRPEPAADAHEAARWRLLAEAARPLLAARGKVSAVRLAHFAYPGSPVAERVAITQAEPGELTPVAALSTLNSGFFGRKRAVMVNADHPTVAQLLGLVERAPKFAAYVLVKLFELGRADASLATDVALALAAD